MARIVVVKGITYHNIVTFHNPQLTLLGWPCVMGVNLRNYICVYCTRTFYFIDMNNFGHV